MKPGKLIDHNKKQYAENEARRLVSDLFLFSKYA